MVPSPTVCEVVIPSSDVSLSDDECEVIIPFQMVPSLTVSEVIIPFQMVPSPMVSEVIIPFRL